MTKLNLKATITSIARFERETGKSLMTAFDKENIGLATIVDLVKACGATEDEIDAFVAENGIEALNDELMAAFKKSGFLAKEAVEAK